MTPLGQVYQQNKKGWIRALSAMRLARNEQEDAIHEAIVRVLSSGHEVAPALLYTAAVNVAKDLCKKELTHLRLTHFITPTPDSSFIEPEKSYEEEQFHSRYEQALGQLVIEQPDEAEAYLLRTQFDLPWADVGRFLGVGARMAQIYVARAVECLREYVHA